MYFLEIPFASPQYDETIDLRHRLLRAPLGLEFKEKDLAEEWDSIHLGYYDSNWNLMACLVLKPVSERILKMRQVAVDDQIQSKGIGTALVKESEKIAIQKGFTGFELNARETAVNFYLKMNYQKVGDRFEEVNIPHFRMEKNF